MPNTMTSTLIEVVTANPAHQREQERAAPLLGVS